ncbi:MAG: pyridoxamine 5'-phosphate oxidase [Bacteroidota bacterium]
MLRRAELSADPLWQFAQWFGEASEGGQQDPAAMTLATVDREGAPDARTVSLKDVDARGFIFTSHYGGPKGRDIEAQPRVALAFYWPSAGRQVRVVGIAERLPAAESDRYFEARSPVMRRALLAMPPSQPIADRRTLDDAVVGVVGRSGSPARPEWGGYVVRPRVMEFWQGQANRLHDRFRYEKEAEGWTLTRLTP